MEFPEEQMVLLVTQLTANFWNLPLSEDLQKAMIIKKIYEKTVKWI